ncbi:hypothetical protein [Pedobacter jamesrossensis]|uniref:Uncharacterized protein n=1 Tax=Pedobacter jamesrossensis TaxID=1908238 RepID=A0ABV8NL19_9SPHI
MNNENWSSDEIINFLNHFEQQQQISQAYDKECELASLSFFGDEQLQPLKLCDAAMCFLVSEFSRGKRSWDTRLNEKMQLFAAYRQGFNVSYGLVIEGNYIKASGVIKQDFEIITRLTEITLRRNKYGRVPNVQNSPVTYREMYNYLNDIAHISKDDILRRILLYEREDKSFAITHAKKFNKVIAHRLMSYIIAIKIELLRQCLNFYKDFIGMDVSSLPSTSFK